MPDDGLSSDEREKIIRLIKALIPVAALEALQTLSN